MQQIADKTEYTEDGTLLALGYKLDEYEIESVLAVGDFRITYYAWDHRGDRNVVIHEYYPRSLCIRDEDNISVTSQSKERFTDFEFGLSEFLLEARLVSQIRSPYLPNVIEYREANGTGYLVSEYDDGRTLAESLSKDPNQFTDKQLNEILRSALQGLRELHARNLLHTSVSPTNLFLRYHGHPILLGQGLARYRLAQYTNTYTISLAPGYTPLEQYGLDGNIGPWSDLYALGASLYECVAGIRPIDASTRHTSLIKGDQDPLTPAVEIGHGSYSNLLLSNIDWMLKPYIEDRPDSADLMLGVVSFQKQSKFIKSDIADTNNPVADKNQSTTEQIKKSDGLLIADESEPAADDPVQIQENQVDIRDNGRVIYWGLGLLLLVFTGFTIYQIYQQELKPNQIAFKDIQTTDPLFSPDAVTPASIQAADADSTSANTEDRVISRESDTQRREFYEGLYKEEEVNRRVEEELEAFKQKQQAERRQQANQKQIEIETLIVKAREALDKNRLLKPAGESAYDYYSSVLMLEPFNEAASGGLNDIADSFFNLAISAIDQQDPEQAGNHLKSLIAVRPDDPRLDGFLEQITDLKAQIEVEKVKLEFAQKAREEQLAENEKSSETAKGDNVVLQNDESVIEKPPLENDKTQTEKLLITDTDVTAESTVDAVAQTKPAQVPAQPDQPVIRTRLANEYARYDRGEYSAELFNTVFKAANANEGRAQYIVAEMYAAGRGVDQNFAESSFWLKKSLDYVNKHAKFRQAWAEKAMGVIYEKGWYVDSNPERAVRWYKSSAEKDYPPAQYRLGLAYAKGLGVNKDNEQAALWLRKAVSNGNQEAKKALSKLPAQN